MMPLRLAHPHVATPLVRNPYLTKDSFVEGYFVALEQIANGREHAHNV